MTAELSQTHFQLIYDGLQDESPDTLRRLKGVLIADFDLSIPEVQEILSKSPSVIKASDSEKEIKQACTRMEFAGAKVHIVRPQAAVPTNPLAHFENEALQPKSPPKPESGGLFSLDAEKDEPEAETEEFIMELDAPEEVEVHRPEPKVYELLETSLEEATPEVETAPEESVQALEPEIAPSEKLPDFDLSIVMEQEPELAAAPQAPEPPTGKVDEPEDEAVSKLKEISALMLDIDEEDEEPGAYALQEERVEKTAEKQDNGRDSTSGIVRQDLTLERDEGNSSEVPVNSQDAQPAPADSPASEVPVLDLTLESDNEESPEAKVSPAPHSAPAAAPQAAARPTAHAPVPARENAQVPAPQAELNAHVRPAPRPTARKKNFDLSAVFEILLPVGIGIGVLLLANKLILPMMTEETINLKQVDLEQRAASLAAEEIKAEREAEREASATLEKDLELKGETTRGELTTSWQARISEKKPVSLTISARTATPPPPSREETVYGKVRGPWIKKAQIDIAKPALAADGSFSYKGPAVIYLEYNHRGTRVSGQAHVQGRYDHASQQLRGSYKVTHNLEDLPEGLPKDTRSFSSYLGSDTFKVFIADSY